MHMARSDNPRDTRFPVRWRVVLMLAGFSFVSYTQRVNISVAARFMTSDLRLTQIQLGEIFSSFLIGYSLFQIPAGILGDRLGPKKVLGFAALFWAVATFLTGFLPGRTPLLHGLGVFAILWILRFILGIAEAGTYPVAACAVSHWIPTSERALANSVVQVGLSLGSAITPPIIAWLVLQVGWRMSFYMSALAPCLLAALWISKMTDNPLDNREIRKTEVDKIVAGGALCGRKSSHSTAWARLLTNRNILLLSFSYCCVGYMGYIFIFWLYTYLVDVRQFTLLSGGAGSSLPFIVALGFTPVGGYACDRLSVRIGKRRARRIIAAGGLMGAALFLLAGARAPSPYIALSALSLCFGFMEFTEGTFWSTTIDVAGQDAGAACGVLNTLCNLGGVVSTALVPILVNRFGWLIALETGSIVALTGAALWCGIDDEVIQAHPEPAHRIDSRSQLTDKRSRKILYPLNRL
jgi:ACS family glucarate transporter-like MFS transporter